MTGGNSHNPKMCNKCIKPHYPVPWPSVTGMSLIPLEWMHRQPSEEFELTANSLGTHIETQGELI